MATHRISIINAYTKPDNNGNTIFEPAAVNFGSNDRYSHMVLAFKSQSARQGIGGAFTVPKNYVGTPVIVVEWATPATSGDVVWDMDLSPIGGDGAESLDPSADTQSATVTDTAPGTARRRAETSMSFTGSNFAADDKVLFNFYRDAADAADTLADTAYAFGVFFQYADV